MRVAAVIPNRDGGAVLERCLDALEAAVGVDEVVVVDDGSTDGSDVRARKRGIQVVPSPGRGFAAAVNEGVAHASADALLVLNSDAFVRPDTVPLLIEVLAANDQIAICGAALEHDDGSRAKSFGRGLTLWRAVRLALSLAPAPPAEGSGVQDVEFLPLACVLARRQDWDAVGGLDDRYRFYFEDYDLCRRLRARGRLLAVRWDARAIHLEGGSSSARDPQGWFRQFHESRLRYLRAHFGLWPLYLVAWVPSALAHAALWLLRAARGDRATALRWARAYLASAFAGLR